MFCLFIYDGYSYSLVIIFKCQRFPYPSSLADQKLCVNTSQGSLKAHKLKFVCYSICLSIHGLWTRDGNNCLTFRGEISHKNNAHKAYSTSSGLGRARTKEREQMENGQIQSTKTEMTLNDDNRILKKNHLFSKGWYCSLEGVLEM